MGFFDVFRKKAKEGVDTAVDKVQDISKEDVANAVSTAADVVQKVTPDSVDKVVDQVADKATEALGQTPQPPTQQPPAAGA